MYYFTFVKYKAEQLIVSIQHIESLVNSVIDIPYVLIWCRMPYLLYIT